MYKQRLEQLVVDYLDVNSTRLKEQLLSHIPELETYQKGSDVLIAFKNDIGSILADASKYGEAIHLAKTADIIRKEMPNTKTKCNNQFEEGSGEESIPPSLLQFVCNIENGVDIKSHLKHGVVKSDLAIAQLLQYKTSQCPSKIDESDLQILEKCVVQMYDRSSSVASVNEARLSLFARKQRS